MSRGGASGSRRQQRNRARRPASNPRSEFCKRPLFGIADNNRDPNISAYPWFGSRLMTAIHLFTDTTLFGIYVLRLGPSSSSSSVLCAAAFIQLWRVGFDLQDSTAAYIRHPRCTLLCHPSPTSCPSSPAGPCNRAASGSAGGAPVHSMRCLVHGERMILLLSADEQLNSENQ